MNRHAVQRGRWEFGFVRCGTWHWSPKFFRSKNYLEFDWGFWVFFAGENAHSKAVACAEDEADFYEQQRFL